MVDPITCNIYFGSLAVIAEAVSAKLIPASDQTLGHSTTGQAKWWKDKLNQWMAK